MEPLEIRTLPHCRTLVFRNEPNLPDAPLLLRLVADYVESESATLLNLHYANSFEGGEYEESVTVTVELDPSR